MPPSLEFAESEAGGSEHNLRNYFLPADALDHDICRDVKTVHLVAQHRGKRGLENFSPVSSTGTLPNGEKYLIYRFLLFWDAFEISEGNSASSEGFYMISLNLPVHARSSPSAVRVLTFTPPGVKISTVFELIQQDIIKGMTEGYLDYDASGEKRRIFLDLVGFIGDTPALNASLDILSHTATAFCHLCRLRRHSATIVGSKYTHTRFHGLSTSAARSFYAHIAVRDCNAKNETCRPILTCPFTIFALQCKKLSTWFRKQSQEFQ